MLRICFSREMKKKVCNVKLLETILDYFTSMYSIILDYQLVDSESEFCTALRHLMHCF